MRRVVLAHLLVGAAFAGLLDGALFHHVLRWHHFAQTGDPRTELLSDGLFALAMTGVLAVGIALARSAARLPARAAWGALFLGAGLLDGFDLVVHHAILRLHALKPGEGALAAEVAWGAFLLALLLVGAALLRSGRALRASAAAA